MRSGALPPLMAIFVLNKLIQNFERKKRFSGRKHASDDVLKKYFQKNHVKIISKKKYLRCSFPSWFQEALDLIWFVRLTDESTNTPPVCLLLARFCFFERVVVVDACGVDRFVLTKSF